ncbi:DUF6491 family protein [Luteimonas sp. e5]
MSNTMKSCAVILGGLLLAGCASTPQVDRTQRLANLMAHAGEPVSSIMYGSGGSGFDLVDDEHLVLSVSPRRNFLIRVDPSCLSWAAGSPALVVDNTSSGQLSVNFDAIRLRSTPGVRCTIREIRPLDLQAAREAEKAQHSGG